MQQQTSKVIRAFSPAKWYDCWKNRIHAELSSTNKFYKSLNEVQINELNNWLSRCFMKIDLLLLEHDNHAMQLQCDLNEYESKYDAMDNNNNNNNNRNFSNFHNPNQDTVKLVAKHALPKALIVSTELPIGYVNFNKYCTHLKLNNENLYSDLLSSDLGVILESSTNIDIDNEQYKKYSKYLHPQSTLFTPKYDNIEGYYHPIWEMVDCIIEYLFRMSIYHHKHDEKLVLNDYDNNFQIDDKLIHYTVIEAFINRYTHDFNDKLCPNPLHEISENPPLRLCDKYSHISPYFFCDIFRIIHLNGYINQTLYLRQILGHGLYGISSFYDHSCDPNVVYSVYNGKLRMCAVKQIKQHQPLTTSYLAEFIDQINLDERRERLKWMGFDCKCIRCVRELRQSKIEQDNNEINDKFQRKTLQDEFLPTIWSELRYFHFVLSEGIDRRWQSRLFRILSFGNKTFMVNRFMKKQIKQSICEPTYNCFHTLDVLAPDAALNDILCNVALKKYKHKFWDRDTKDRALQEYFL